MLMQKKMGLLVTSVTLILTIITFAPYLIPVTVPSDGSTQSETFVETTPAPPGMLAYWELNENGGTIVHDSVGPYINGYTYGNPSWVPGIAGSGIELLTNQFIDFGAPTALYTINYLTIEAWVYLPDTSGLHTLLMNSYSSTYIMYDFAIEDGHLYFDRQAGAPGNSFTSSAIITAGKWHHVAVVMDTGPDTISFYINGTEEIIHEYNDYFSGPTGRVTIGADRSTGTPSFLRGMIDEVAVYNSIITQSVFQEHYEKGLLGLGYLDDFPINVAPVATDDSYIMDQDTTLIVGAPGVLANDIDVDGNPLETDFVSGPSNGGLVLNPDGSFVYTPAGGFVGIDSFQYRAYDRVDYSASATVTITVEAVNHPPVALDDVYTTDEDAPLLIISDGVLVNDYDPEPWNILSAELVTNPQHGSLLFYSDGGFEYCPDPDWSGTDTFTYRASDGINYGNEATVSINVIPINDVPVAGDDAYAGFEDIELTGSSLLLNDYDADGDVLEINLVSGPSHGVLTLYPDGSLTYMPNVDWFGTDSFTYELYDGQVYSNLATVTLTIAGENDAPVAFDGSFVGDEDLDLYGGVSATDIEGNPITYELVAGSNHGNLIFNVDGTFTYSPGPNWFGADAFTFRVFDGQDYSNIATATITITSVNDLPIAGDDEFTANEDSELIGSVFNNDYDVEWDVRQAHVVSGPAHGILDFNMDTGVFRFLPETDWFGIDSFTYYVFDGHVFSNVATVTLMIMGVNDAPVAYDGLYTGYQDVVLYGTVLATDVEGDPITYELVAGPNHGILIFNADGTFTYSPDIGWFGIDTYTYRAIDTTDYSNIATVTIEIIEDDDITGPEITILYSGDSTDGSPGTWTVTVVDPESGVDSINVVIDGISVGTTEGVYAVPNSIGEHTITVIAVNADLDYGPADQESSTLTNSVTIIDDDTTGPEISIIYSGGATDASPGTWTVTVIDPESGIDSINIEIDGISVGTTEGVYVVPNSLGLHTIIVTVVNADLDTGPADQETSTLSHSVTITDDDTTAPSISIIYTGDMTNINPGYWTISVSDLESGVISILVEIDGVLAGTTEGDYAVPGTGGSHTISVTAINNDMDRPSDQETSTDTNTVEIEEITKPTEIIYTGDVYGVYSDPVCLEALLLDAVDQLPIPGKTLMFALGSQTAYAVTNEDGVASVVIILDQEEGIYELVVLFVGDDDYLGSSTSIEFAISKECASIIYSGMTIIQVSEESITLRVTAFDDVDGYWGDITNIYVTFTIYLASDPLAPVYVSCPIQVQAIDVAGVGLATVEIPNLAEGDYIVTADLLPEHNRYYCAPDSQAVTITIYEPERAFVKGVGTIKDADGHNGHFAFRVSYSCKGSLEGFFVYSSRNGDWISFMRSYDILGFSTDGNHGFFEASGTITRFNIRTLRIVCSDETYQFRVDVFDNKRGREKDVFQFRILDNLGLVEYEAGFDPFGYLMRGCIVVQHYKKH